MGTPTAEAAQRAVLVFQTALILRFALSEVAMVVAIAVAFVVEEGGFLVVLLGCARVPLREALYGELA